MLLYQARRIGISENRRRNLSLHNQDHEGADAATFNRADGIATVEVKTHLYLGEHNQFVREVLYALHRTLRYV